MKAQQVTMTSANECRRTEALEAGVISDLLMIVQRTVNQLTLAGYAPVRDSQNPAEALLFDADAAITRALEEQQLNSTTAGAERLGAALQQIADRNGFCLGGCSAIATKALDAERGKVDG